MLLPRTCAVCGAPAGPLCAPCRSALRPPVALPAPCGVDLAAALFAHEGTGRDVVHALKFRNGRALAPGLGRGMARLAVLAGAWDGAAVTPPAVVTWVPTTGARRRARGYDQAELLARAVARPLGLRCTRLLEASEGPAQTGRDRAARLGRAPLRACRPAPAGVVVVDDVRTTGATLAAAAAALREVGAVGVVALTLAAAP